MIDQKLIKGLVNETMARNGGKLPPMPDGPYVQAFDPLLYAQAIDSELNRCGDRGWLKIQFNITLEDAAALAAYLRRASTLVR